MSGRTEKSVEKQAVGTRCMDSGDGAQKQSLKPAADIPRGAGGRAKRPTVDIAARLVFIRLAVVI
jgi:hypothetical protein